MNKVQKVIARRGSINTCESEWNDIPVDAWCRGMVVNTYKDVYSAAKTLDVRPSFLIAQLTSPSHKIVPLRNGIVVKLTKNRPTSTEVITPDQVREVGNINNTNTNESSKETGSEETGSEKGQRGTDDVSMREREDDEEILRSDSVGNPE